MGTSRDPLNQREQQLSVDAPGSSQSEGIWVLLGQRQNFAFIGTAFVVFVLLYILGQLTLVGGVLGFILIFSIFFFLVLPRTQSRDVDAPLPILSDVAEDGTPESQSFESSQTHDTEHKNSLNDGHEFPSRPSTRDIAPYLNQALQRAFERFPEPVLLLDAEGRVVLANEETRHFVGDAAIDRHISALIRTPSVLEAVQAVLDGAPPREVEYSLPVPVERFLRASVIPLNVALTDSAPDDDENVSAVLLAVHDLTEVKRSEQLRVDFVANASHELRTPLASLNGFIQTLRGHARDDEEVREKFLSIMEDQTDRMRRLIDDLLSLSRIELNEHVAPKTSVDLASVALDVCDALSPLAEKRDQSIIVNWEGQPIESGNNISQARILGDRDELVQVVQNLIDNAIKYGNTGGKVHINLGLTVLGRTAGPNSSSPIEPLSKPDIYPSIESGETGSAVVAALENVGGTGDSQTTAEKISQSRNDQQPDTSLIETFDRLHEPSNASVEQRRQYVYLSVHDDGIGIPREHLPRLTERFYRIDANKSRKIGGTGLGLAIVKHIVNRHRGTLSIDSTKDVGSTFTIFLPRIVETETQLVENSETEVVAFKISEPKNQNVK